MSNQVVGGVYDQIIDDVIKKSKEDFEENGVDMSVLEELREGWKKKLTQLNVAQFPWDPKPDSLPAPPKNPPAAASSSAAAPANNYATSQLSPNPMGMPLPSGGSGSGNQNGSADVLPKMEPMDGIKREPGLATTPAMGSAPNYPNMRNDVAAVRAQEKLQKSYGNKAASSISAIQQGQQRHMPAQNQQYRPPTGPTLPQTDGADEDDDDEVDGLDAVMMKRAADGSLEEMGRVEIDGLIHKRIMERAKAMEGGGLMVPLKEATKYSKAARLATTTEKETAATAGPSQLDGTEDGQVEDEDAINSDLDDSEDGMDNSEEEEEGLTNIMLCMYDKVQRVKNKWKCTLKDGILTVNNKEYVFHKATGEYEW